MRRKRTLARMERALCIPEGTLYDTLRMEFTSNRRVVVEGYRRILQYEEYRIVLDTVEGQVTFEGDALCVNCLEDQRAAVSGQLLTVSFSR